MLVWPEGVVPEEAALQTFRTRVREVVWSVQLIICLLIVVSYKMLQNTKCSALSTYPTLTLCLAITRLVTVATPSKALIGSFQLSSPSFFLLSLPPSLLPPLSPLLSLSPPPYS